MTPRGQHTRLAIALALVLAAGGTARADEEPARVPSTTVSIGLAGLVYRGVAVDVERDLPAHRISVVGGLALRSTAGGDYDSVTVGLAGEVRYWFKRRAIWTARPAGSPIGWYVGARLDLASTTVTDAMGDSLGAQRALALSTVGGYRFAPWRGLEIRPHAGLAWRREWGDAVAPWTRGGLVFGLAAGWSW